nr:hypothetical protein [Tanacetum cinerariifolium]
KAFRVFNIKRKEIEETYHVTFSKDDEAITKSSIEGDEINFNENRSFSDDELLVLRSKVSQSSGKDDYFPYVPAYDPLYTNNITIPDHCDPSVSQDITILEPTIEAEPSPTNNSQSVEVFTNPPVPQDRWSREKHIKLVNIQGEPQAGVTTRSRIEDSKATSSHEYLYVNFLSDIELKKLTEALVEKG